MKGDESTKETSQTLKQLCTDNKEVIGKMVNLLQELNSPPNPIDQRGICYPLSGGACIGGLTKAQCDSVPGIYRAKYGPERKISGKKDGRLKSRRDAYIESMLRELPDAGKKLHQLCMKNEDLVQELVELLRDAKKGRGGPVGICRLPNGECRPGTKKECAKLGGVWSAILPG
jgi:hypothetical protein